MAKNQQNGLIQNLDSQATINSQPTKDMNAGSGTIKYADPQSPSTNPATRREKYNIETSGTTTPEQQMLTTIGGYQTTTPSQIPTPKFEQNATETPANGIIKDKGSFSYGVQGGDSALELIKKSLEEAGVDSTLEMYGPVKTKAVQDYISSQYQLGELMNQQTGLLNNQSPNVQRIIDLSEEVAMARALGYNNAKEIAQALNQEERVIQKIMNGQANELVQLNKDYVDKQLKDYIRAGEDYTTNIQRNIVQFQNAKQNLDYQFNSAMDTIERNLFDSERAARTSSAIFGMTGTKYTIDRLRTQYQQQMDDLQNTYDFQSASAQFAINNALEDYTTNMMRLSEDYDEAYKVVQQNVLATMQNLNNQVGLTIKQQSDILTNLQTNVAQMKANALSTYLAGLEAGNQTFSDAIANAYGLDVSGLTSTKTPGGGTYTPTNQATVDGALYSVTSSSKYADKNKIRSGQCGTIVNDYLGMLGSGFRISYASDMEKYINYRGTDPMVGSIAYFAPGTLPGMSDDGKKYGHVAIVTGVNKEKGTITVRESNAGTGIQDHEYSMSDVAGYFNPVGRGQNIYGGETEGVGGESNLGTDYVTGYEGDYKNFLQKGTNGFSKASQERLTEKFGSWDNFAMNAEKYSNAIDKQVTDVADTMLRNMITLRDWLDESGDEDYSMTALRIGFPGTDAHSKKRMYKQIIASDALQNLINLKSQGATFGALSDNELGFITEAANWFNLWDNEENFVGELNRKIGEILNKYDMTENEFINSGRGGSMPSAQINPSGGMNSDIFVTPGSAYTGGGSVNNGANIQGAQQSGTVNTGPTQMWGN